jgi:uncharacterized membrane protein (DUF373 family)
MSAPWSQKPEARHWIAWAFTLVEDVVYIGLGLLLAGSALFLLERGVIDFWQSIALHDPKVIELLDRILLILLIVELLYTVQVSFREHVLAAEPFLLVGLISAIRRVLLITAEFGELRKVFSVSQWVVIELGVLTVLILALTGSLVLVRKMGPMVAQRGPSGPPDEVPRTNLQKQL